MEAHGGYKATNTIFIIFLRYNTRFHNTILLRSTCGRAVNSKVCGFHSRRALAISSVGLEAQSCCVSTLRFLAKGKRGQRARKWFHAGKTIPCLRSPRKITIFIGGIYNHSQSWVVYDCFSHTNVLVGDLEHFYFSIYRECHHPNWRTPSFSNCVALLASVSLTLPAWSLIFPCRFCLTMCFQHALLAVSEG